MTVIRCEHVAKTFGGTVALDDISLAIAGRDVQFVEEPRGAHAVRGVARAARALGEGLPPTTARGRD